jgi:hypothetical protein
MNFRHDARLLQILSLHRQGFKYGHIARMTRVSVQRVQQLVVKAKELEHHNLTFPKKCGDCGNYLESHPNGMMCYNCSYIRVHPPGW